MPVEPDTVVRTGEVMVVGNEPFTHYELETTQGRYHLALPEDSSLSLSTTGPTYLEVTGYVEADSGKSGGNPILQALTWRKASAADCKVTETWDDMPDC